MILSFKGSKNMLSEGEERKKWFLGTLVLIFSLPKNKAKT
jgi:hypothetical protein